MIGRRRFLGLVLLGAGAATVADTVFSPRPAHARKPEIYQGLVSGVGAGGYDVVAYFTESEAVKGKAAHVHRWKDANWHFATPENRDRFAANPSRYAPQYGGHCAWAAAEGYTAKGDPRNWDVVNGKLYLNFNSRIQRRWQRDVPGNIARADANWPGILTR